MTVCSSALFYQSDIAHIAFTAARVAVQLVIATQRSHMALKALKEELLVLQSSLDDEEMEWDDDDTRSAWEVRTAAASLPSSYHSYCPSSSQSSPMLPT